MKIVMIGDDDWFSIEKAEHDGRTWFERTAPNCLSLRCSCRISDADVEGTAEEMLEIADAIKHRQPIAFKRCAVSIESDGVHFWSPRNSTKDGVVTLEEADELSEQIFSELKYKPSTTNHK